MDLIVSPPHKYICWIPNVQCDYIRRWHFWGVIKAKWGPNPIGLVSLFLTFLFFSYVERKKTT